MKALIQLESWLVDVIRKTQKVRNSCSFLDSNRYAANGELVAYRDVKRKVRKLMKEKP